MAGFDLERFRDLAFGRKPLPDHPMGEVASAQKLLRLLPEDDPDTAIAELTSWAATMNVTDSFTPGRRARVLMLLDDAARPVWRALGQRYLAPGGRPAEGRDGDAKILGAMFDSASEFANGFALCLDETGGGSKWVHENLPRLTIRNLRWLSRRLALAHMLHKPVAAALWERLHRLYALSVERQIERTTLPAYEEVNYKTSIKREYVRPLLLELANPTSLQAREVEFVYRIAARIASTVQLEPVTSSAAAFAVMPAGDARPTLVGNLKKGAAAPLYIATANALPRLRAFMERDLGRDPGDEDSVFGRGYTLRERNAIITKLIDFWGFDPPQRRQRRVGMATPVRLIAGFEHVLNVLPPLLKGQMGSRRDKLKLQLDQTSKSLKRATLRAAQDWRGRLADASTGGMGIALAVKTAPWVKHGALITILIEPGNDWVLGVVRRIYTIGEELRLGVQILSTRPCALWLQADITQQQASVWEEAMRHEALFGEHYLRAILLEAPALPLTSGEFLLPPKLASKGARFSVPLPGGDQRLKVARLHHDGEHYQRAMYEAIKAG